ncbi:leucyl/phenylalanyl-tRNA--protein transferase [Falsirhodobacter algicola]|uniref:Leucyl/phenylalanyl-tRNA--protein transferase n=1 Tax=Falsirhodobacter algicola TaxID=2692330 RepID=A0A8J8SKJ3_9RHOB|nr:leucyl/phenylalanyl-tRNA--protein transferase [Falsirhodobacter algicola]QUS35546.1 leucyl/phenylalanyl-tRNA--protein transferase [Falsirhodobacter algicola]
MLTAGILLRAYAMGAFPMAESRSSQDITWVEPFHRGIFPLDGFHISRSLSKAIRRADYEIRVNHGFTAVMNACADRPETWINDEIIRLYGNLHAMGHAHSLEVWANGALVGGTYGVTLGGAFFGESMFSRRANASKIALAWLVHRLRAGGFVLFDTQFLTAHLATLGAVEIPRAEYQRRLRLALGQRGDFHPAGYAPSADQVSHSSTHTS